MAELFDVSQLDTCQTRWVRVGLNDMEVELKRVTPEQFSAFQRRMVSFGVVAKGKGQEINSGRFVDYHVAFAREFLVGWKNLVVNGVKNPPYDPEQMGHLMARSSAIQQAVGEATTEEQAFFSRNGSASHD
jgi:hypothetical protein